MNSKDTQHHRASGEMTPSDLANRARQLRMEANLTQAQLAKRTGYSTSTISKAENYREGDGMIGARIFIIETLTEEAVEGPLYRTSRAGEPR